VRVPASPPETHGDHPVGRGLLFIGWTLVLWGTLVAGAMAWRSVQFDLATAVRMALRGASPEWGWINLSCAGLAVVVWTALGVLLVRRHRDAGS
jgi:hypothetical protein